MAKKLLKTSALIALFTAVILMSGCVSTVSAYDDGSGVGTIIVQNVSSYRVDNIVYIDISNARNPNDVFSHQFGVQRNQQVTFYDVPAGYQFKVWVLENNGAGDARSSDTFILVDGQTIVYSYDGLRIRRH